MGTGQFAIISVSGLSWPSHVTDRRWPVYLINVIALLYPRDYSV